MLDLAAKLAFAVGDAQPSPAAPTAITLKVLRAMNTDASVEILTANGRPYRWGGDEADAGSRPLDLRWSSAIPGGDDTMSCRVLRHDDDVDYADLELGNEVIVRSPAGDAWWSGRLAETPKSGGRERSIAINAVGWNSHLKDDEGAREVYVDADLARFAGGSSVAHLLARANSQYRPAGEVRVANDEGNPALVLAHNSDFTNVAGSHIEIVEAWYHANGVPIGQVWYDVDTFDKFTADLSLHPGWILEGVLSDNDTHSVGGYDATGNLLSATTGLEPYRGYFPSSPSTNPSRRYFVWQLYLPVSTGGQGDWKAYLRNMRAYGQHGLTKRGPDPGGFYLDDLVRDILTRWAPKLTIGPIESSGRIVPHFVFVDPTTPEQMILALNRLFNLDWGVYGREFFMLPPGTYGRTWLLSEEEGAKADDQGLQLENTWQGVVVVFTDAAGQTRTYGPSDSGATYLDDALRDNDPSNPLNKHGYQRRYKRVELPGRNPKEIALEVGKLALGDLRRTLTRGTVNVTGEVLDSHGSWWPVAEMKAGDHVIFAERRDRTPRQIIRNDYRDRPGYEVTAELDARPHRLDAIMEWLQAVSVGVG